MGAYHNTTVWILARNGKKISIAVGLIRLDMSGVKYSFV